MAMKFEIKYRWNNEIKVVLEGTSRNQAIKKAIQEKVDLRDSDLSDADLSDSDLRGSDLRGSNLRGSDLSGSNLSGSDLRGSNLSGSDLSDSDLSGSNLRGSDLSDSDLRGSNLSGSDLRGSDLRDSNLRGSNLRVIRDDFWAVLSSAPAEVEGLRIAIVEGRIDGSTYTGECACLVGTMEKVAAGMNEKLVVLKRNGSRPAERFFLNIKKGETPETNQVSKIVLEWLDQWLDSMKTAFGNKSQ
jgi:hypothetical protein